MARPATDRFWSKVDKTGSCWLWTGWTNGTGYGRFDMPGQKVYAHRFAYELERGPIPAGMQIDHLCRNRLCVNPAHLEAVTQRENILRGESVQARNARKTHCPKGHEYTDANTYERPDRDPPGRECKTCRDARNQARYRKVVA